MNKRIHVFITGEVQGVFFRDATKQHAIACNVTGWVRNLRDGRVEAVFEGRKEDVDSIVAFVHEGPEYASVTDVEVLEEEYTGERDDFQTFYSDY